MFSNYKNYESMKEKCIELHRKNIELNEEIKLFKEKEKERNEADNKLKLVLEEHASKK